MARVKRGASSRKRRKKTLKLAKGYYGSKHTLYRTANEQVMRSYRYAYRDRKQLKREMRKIWIQRINAAARLNGTTYSRLMFGLRSADIQINRKMLSEMAIHDPNGFADLVEVALEAAEKAQSQNGKVQENKKSEEVEKEEVKTEETKTEVNPADYGSTWIEVVATMIEKHCDEEFTFDELLAYQHIAAAAYPKNNTIPETIRRNLNQLVEEGKIEDLGEDKFKQV